MSMVCCGAKLSAHSAQAAGPSLLFLCLGTDPLMRRIVIVAFHVYPDLAVGAKRVSELANHLSRRGWDIVLVTHKPRDADPSRQLHSAITRVLIDQPRPIALRLLDPVRRVMARGVKAVPTTLDAAGGATTAADSNRFARALSRVEGYYHRVIGVLDPMKKWSVMVTARLMRGAHLRNAQVIMVSGPPWSPVLAASIVGLLRHRRVLIDFRDPWLFERGDDSPRCLGFQRWVDRACERFCLRHAQTVTVSTESFFNTLSRRHPQQAHKMHTIRNGYDDNMMIASAAPVGRLAILYAGTIYIGRNPLPLLHAIAQLVVQPDIDRQLVRLQLVGYCNEWNGRPLIDIARELSIDDVIEIQPVVPSSRVRELTEQANVIVNFAQGHPEQAPAKLYEQLVSNRYGLLFTEADSESARIAGEVNAIFRLDDSPAQVLNTLRHLYDELVVHRRAPAVTAADAGLSRACSNESFEKLLGEMYAGG